MAGPLDPFTPGQDETPYAGVAPGSYDKIRNEWGAFLSDPAGRAAVMSMGLALTAPPSFGDNGLSQIGRAIGAGGESARLTEAQDLKRTETESKDERRRMQSEIGLANAETRATAAEARVGMAGARNEASSARLALAERSLELKQQQLTSQALTAEARLQLQRDTLKLQQEIAEIRRSEGAARTELGQSRLQQAQERLETTQRTGQERQEAAQKNSQLNNKVRLMIAHRKAADNARLMGQPEPSFDDWLRATGLSESEDDTPVPPAASTTSGYKVGERKQFKQGWGVWNGSTWVPEK